MFKRKIDANLIYSLSKLQDTNYTSNKEFENVYTRLSSGRDSFAKMYESNLNATSEISKLDLEISFYTEKLLQISKSVSDATKDIHEAASESADVASVIAARHEDLTNTIVTVSEESSHVYQKIDSSQQSLTDIRKLSEDTITISQKMQEDMNQLSDIIHNMNEVISAITNISAQTNLLSLNASIEASRAGESGRGFAVVADEIRTLADETRSLTDNMGQFVLSVQEAADASAQSVNQAIEALDEVNSKIKAVWTLNEENQSHIAGITDSIGNLAAVSEELTSNMMEIESEAAEIEKSCNVLKQDTLGLESIGKECSDAIKPIKNVESQMDNLLSHMGNMSLDPFYALTNDELVSYVVVAMNAHRSWISKLGDIVKDKNIIPFQVNAKKCHFGHFYDSIKLTNPEIKEIWQEIGEKHKNLHLLGAKVIAQLFDEEYHAAEDTYKEAVTISQSLVKQLETVKNMIQTN